MSIPKDIVIRLHSVYDEGDLVVLADWAEEAGFDIWALELRADIWSRARALRAIRASFTYDSRNDIYTMVESWQKQGHA